MKKAIQKLLCWFGIKHRPDLKTLERIAGYRAAKCSGCGERLIEIPGRGWVEC